jgi:2'-5' RNA ligase
MSDKIRAFIAVDMPESIRSKIKNLQEGVDINGLKFVDPAIIHLTLKFLGDTPQKKIDDVCRVLEAIETSRFEVTVACMGAFPNLKNPRIIWIGLSQDSKLERIAENIEDRLSKLGFEREKRKFTSHLTIARVKRAGKNERRLIKDFVRENANIDLGKILIDRLKLKRSVLTPQGPIYSDIHIKKLSSSD